MIKIILAFGDQAYEIQCEHEGETHPAQEWYDIYSEAWRGGYNPTEILEFTDENEALRAVLDPGTSLLPRYYQIKGVSDSDIPFPGL